MSSIETPATAAPSATNHRVEVDLPTGCAPAAAAVSLLSKSCVASPADSGPVLFEPPPFTLAPEPFLPVPAADPLAPVVPPAAPDPAPLEPAVVPPDPAPDAPDPFPPPPFPPPPPPPGVTFTGGGGGGAPAIGQFAAEGAPESGRWR